MKKEFTVKFEKKELKIRLKNSSFEKTFFPLLELLKEKREKFSKLEKLKIDFKELNGIDNRGVNVLLGIIIEADKNSAKTYFKNLNEKMKLLFKSMNFGKIVEIED